MANDGTVRIGTEIDDSGFRSGMERLNGVASAGLKATGAALAAVSGALVAAGAAAVKFGAEFEASAAKASTLFGDVAVDTKNLNNKILELSSSTGVAATELNEALYSALSAGIPVTEDMAEATGFLSNSTKLAKAGFTDIDTALSATAKTLNAYKLGTDQTERIQGILIQTQNKGITTVGELGASLAQVTPTAAAFSVSFENVGAALATMTAQGTPTAQATTQLNSLIAELGKQGTLAQKGLAKAAEGTKFAGKSFAEMMQSGASLSDVIGLLEKSADKSGKSLVDMFSSIEAGKAALAIASGDAKTFNANLEAMMDTSGLVDEAYEKVSNTLQAQMGKLKESVKNLGIAIFNENNTVLSQAAGFGAEMVSKLTEGFSEGGASGMIQAFGNVVSEALTGFAGFLPQFIQTGFQLLGAIGSGIMQAAPQIASAAIPIIEQLANGFLTGVPRLITAAAQIVQQLAQGIQQSLPELIPAAAQAILTFSENLRASAGKLIEAGLQLIISLGNGLIQSLPALIQTVPQIVTNIANIINDNAPKLIVAALTLIKNLAVGLIQAIPELIKAIPQIIEAIVSAFLAFNWLNLGKTIITSLKNGIVSMVSSVQGTARNILDTINNTLQTLPSKLLELGRGGITGLINGIKAMLSGVTSVMGTILNAIINGVKSIPSQILNIGKNIISGLINGIKSGISGLLGVVADLGKTVVNKMKSVFKIHSPSRLMRDEIGAMIVKGVAVGISKTKDAEKAAQQMAKNTLDETKKTLGIKNASSEFREQVGAKIVAGTAQGIKNNSKTAEDAAKETSQKILQAATQWVSDKKKYFDMSLEEESAFWEDLKTMTGLKADELQQIDRKLYEARQELRLADAEAQKKAFEEASKASEDYVKNIESRADALRNFVGLFDEVGKSSELTADELTERLEEQVLQLERYQNDMALLAQRGVPSALLDTLRDLGPKAAHEIRVLSQMSSEELQNYVDLFAKKTRLAVDQAQREVGEFKIPVSVQELTPEQVRLIYENLNKSLNELASSGEAFIDGIAKSAENNMGLIGAVASNTVNEYVKNIDNQLGMVKNTGVAMVKTLQGALTGNKNLVQSAAKDIATTFTGEATKAVGESRQIGNDLVSSMVAGIENGKGSLFSAVSGMISDALHKADDEIRRKSRGSAGTSESSTYSADVSTFAARMAPRMPDVQASFSSAASSFTPSAVSNNVTNNSSERTIVNKIEMPVTVYGSTGNRQDARNIGREIGKQAEYEMRRRGLKV